MYTSRSVLKLSMISFHSRAAHRQLLARYFQLLVIQPSRIVVSVWTAQYFLIIVMVIVL